MIRLWSREVIGWSLLLIGLFAFYQSYRLLMAGTHQVLEAGTLAIIGVVIFRGGIHMLKVAVAAEVCLTSQSESNDNTKRGGLPASGAALAPRSSHI